MSATKTITCSFLDSTTVTITLKEGDSPDSVWSLDYIWASALKTAIAKQTGHDPNTLSVVDSNGENAVCVRNLSSGNATVTVIVHGPPVKKLYRIEIETADRCEHVHMIELAVPQGDDSSHRMKLMWASDLRGSSTSKLNAMMFCGSDHELPFCSPSNSAFYFLELNGGSRWDEDHEEITICIIYIPSTGTWMPHLVLHAENEVNVTRFSVTEVNPADLHVVKLAVE